MKSQDARPQGLARGLRPDSARVRPVVSQTEMHQRLPRLRVQDQDLSCQHRELFFMQRASVSPERHLVCSAGRLGFCLLFKPSHAEVLHIGRNIIRERRICL